MSNPAFPQPDGNQLGKILPGISQRRLLAGMILGPVVAAVTTDPPKEPLTVDTITTIVKACVVFADELITQTEET